MSKYLEELREATDRAVKELEGLSYSQWKERRISKAYTSPGFSDRDLQIHLMGLSKSIEHKVLSFCEKWCKEVEPISENTFGNLKTASDLLEVIKEYLK